VSDYRDWEHLPGEPPEGAPEGLVDVYHVPGLIEPGGSWPAPTGATGEAAVSLLWSLPLILLVAVAAMRLWRRRRVRRLAAELGRLERVCRRGDGLRPDDLRALADAAVVAIGRWQHGRSGPVRARLAAPWDERVRELDHARFGARPALEAGWLAERLRRMRRELRQSRRAT
jgi:HAMP domain-containing protein